MRIEYSKHTKTYTGIYLDSAKFEGF